MPLIALIFILLVPSCLFGETAEDWENIPLGETSIHLEYVENEDGIPGLFATLPFHIDGDVFLEKLYDPLDETNAIKNVEEVAVISEGEDWQIVYFRTKVLWWRFEYSLRYDFNREDDSFSWLLLSGDLEMCEGYWKVIEKGDGKCYVEYMTFTRPKLGFLNSFLKPIYMREMRSHLIEKQQIMKSKGEE